MISTPTDRRRPPGRAKPRTDVQPNFPTITRPVGLQRAATPPAVVEPQHHHLPAWVRRAYGQARPILADQLAALSGESREQFERSIDDFTARISEGKFSQAFNYSQLIAHGQQLVEEQRRENAEVARAQRAVETARRHASDALRDASTRLSGDAAARLNKALKAAAGVDAIKEVEAEVRQAIDSARGIEERRREREISRTKTRIQKTTPRAASASGQTEDWQDVLRRLQSQMAAEESGS